MAKSNDTSNVAVKAIANPLIERNESLPTSKVAAAGAAIEITHIELDAPYGKFLVNRVDGIDHAGMRAEQLREVLILMADADKANLMLRTARPLGGEVYDRTRLAIEDNTNGAGLIAASLFAGEVFDFLLTIELDAEAGIMLWLAQQLCDELRGTLAGMAESRGAV